MANICATCLSTNRQLFLIELKNFSWIDIPFCKGTTVCWECRSLFSKLQKFRNQILKAQAIFSRAKRLKGIVSLSTLRVTHKHAFDSIYLSDEVVKQESAFEPEVDPEAAGCEPATTELLDELSDGAAHFESDSLSQPVRPECEQDQAVSGSPLPDDNVSSSQQPRFIIMNLSEEDMQQNRLNVLKSAKYVSAKYKCDNCAVIFNLEVNYNKHMLKHSPDAGNFMCRICGQRFQLMTLATKHFLSHYRFYQCSVCEFKHHLSVVVQSHFENHHEATLVFPCHLCDQEFLTPRRKKAHVETVHKAAPKCSECNKTFSNTTNLKLHMSKHEPRPMLECNVCHKLYKGQVNLEIHMRKHADRPPAEDAYCAECDKRFKTRWHYQTHLKYANAHASEEHFRFQCNECGRKFTKKSTLEEHMEREHIMLLKYSCDRCEQKFVSRRQIRRHVHRVHVMNGVVDKRVNCDVCGKEFVSAGTCKIHQRVHTGERPYHCPLCPMRFSQKSTLNTHVKGKHKVAAGLQGWRGNERDDNTLVEADAARLNLKKQPNDLVEADAARLS